MEQILTSIQNLEDWFKLKQNKNQLTMPYVNIKITDEQVTKEQKRQLVEGVTKVLVDVLNKNPKTTHIVIDEIPLENWGYDGQLTSELRKQQ